MKDFNRNLFQSILSLLLSLSAFLFGVNDLCAVSIPKEKWNLVLYGGIFTETDLLPIVLRQKTEYRESYIGTVGFNRPLDYKIRFIDFELEGNLTKHFGEMRHWEFNLFYVAKINRIQGSPFSFSLGEGLSQASENPKLENKAKGFYLDGYQSKSIESRATLNYLMVEFSSYLPFERKTEIFLRIHHRSGIFGLYCPPDPNCGSNFVSYGIRTAL
ncbi:MAG: hypothetical protein O9301_08875 [Leptospira sp.]|nr:hypothetical protein [Leptospira sp.]